MSATTDWTDLPYAHPRQLPNEDDIRRTRSIIEQIDRSIEDLQRKKAPYVSYIAPFRRLPTEILSEIISISIEDGADILVMAGICSRLREVVLGMAEIWGTIKLHSIDSEVRSWISNKQYGSSREVSY
jgi:hypothetical protein